MSIQGSMYIYPDFITPFSCAMCGVCCRNEWQVTVDETSYWRSQTLFASLNKMNEFQQAFVPLAGQGGRGEYAYIAKRDGKCWFLDSNHRCSLQLTAGHDHLDLVCQTYPRYPVLTDRGWEVTLSFSCPAVLQLVTRLEPLQLIRSSSCPLTFAEQATVAEVFPRQQPSGSPLQYYFELEHHIIDILQFRILPLSARLEFLAQAVSNINTLAGRETLGSDLRHLLYSHYESLDRQAGGASGQEMLNQQAVNGAILAEHFLVNLVFKKVGYLYGLDRMVRLLQEMWRTIETACQDTHNQAEELSNAKAAIMKLELQYSHNRQALLALR